MSTAPLPWTTEHAGDGAVVKDRTGKTIARFDDWRDAEVCVGFHATLAAITAEKEALESVNEDLEGQLRDAGHYVA